MKTLKINISTIVLTSLFLILMSSCEDTISTENIPDRLFRPAQFGASIEGNMVTFTWVPIANASYALEISKDSLFQTDLQTFLIDGVNQFKVEDLWSQTRYFARIKSISKDPMIKDSEYKQITFVTGLENILYSVPPGDIGANQILLKWDSTKEVSHIVVSTINADDTVIQLSDSEKASGEKMIGNLQSGTEYTFKIYFGEMPRGTISVITSA